MYVAYRALRSEFKLSFHCRTGRCNVSFTESAYANEFEDGPLSEDRYLERWNRPPPIGPGVTLLCRVIAPGGSLSEKTEAPASIFWVPDPGLNHAVEFAALVTTGDEGSAEIKRHVIGTSPVGEFELSNGEVIHVRYRVMPFVLKAESRRGATYFFKSGRNALASNERLRAVVYCVGSLQDRVLLDVPATFKNS